MGCVAKLGYPISTLPEHLHSTSLSYAETTLNSKKLVSFPLIAHYLSAGPPLPPTPPLHRETRPHPHLTIILYFSAQEVGRTSGRCHSLCLIRPKGFETTGVFFWNWLYWHSVFHIWIMSYIYIYIYIRSAFTYFCEKGGGGSELRFSVLLPGQFCVFSDDVIIFGFNSRWSSSFCVFECFL